MNELIAKLRDVLDRPQLGCDCGLCKMMREAHILLDKAEAPAMSTANKQSHEQP